MSLRVVLLCEVVVIGHEMNLEFDSQRFTDILTVDFDRPNIFDAIIR